MQRQELLAELTRLIRSTQWAADKQAAWLLAKCGQDDWRQCSNATIQDAITHLRRFDEMFSGDRLDPVPPQGNNTGRSREERESLRIYLGEEE